MSENPYNPLQPVSDPTLFVGRQEAFAFLQRHLAGGINHKAIVIIGQRGIGKSSLLAQVPFHVDERYPCVFIDVKALELDDTVSFVAAIVDYTRNLLETLEASTYRLPPFPDPTDPTIDLLTWLADDYLSVVLAAIWRERHLVLMFDGMQAVFEAIDAGAFPPNFMDFLDQLLQKYERLDMIVAFDIAYEDRILQTPPFDDGNLHYRLTPLSPEETQQLVLGPLEDRFSFSKEGLARLLELVGGHPFHIHSLCRLIFRLVEERAHLVTITPSEIEVVYSAALEQATEIVQALWGNTRPNERLVLRALLDLQQHNPHEVGIPPGVIQEWLSQTDYPLNDIQLAAAWRGLEYLGIVKTMPNGAYAFVAGIQANALLDLLESDEDLPKGSEQLQPLSWRLIMSFVVVISAVVVIGVLLFGSDNGRAEPSEDKPPVATLQPNPTASSTPPPIFRVGG